MGRSRGPSQKKGIGEGGVDDVQGGLGMACQEGAAQRQGSKYDLVELIDLDDDGDLDVLTCEENVNLGVIWYENPTIR